MSKVQLGFGTLRYSVTAGSLDKSQIQRTIDEYMTGTYCYFDLHPNYAGGMAQDLFRELVVTNYSRDKYLVANKMVYWGIKQYRDYELVFHEELQKCALDYFDYYMLHSINYERYLLHEQIGGFEFLQELKKKGLAKKIGISFHGSPELLQVVLKKYTWLDFVYLQINYVDWENPVVYSKELYEIARLHRKEIIIMEPIKGGSLANKITVNDNIYGPEKLAKIALEFVAALEGVEIVLSGMVSPKQVRENRRTIENIYRKDGVEKYKSGYYESIMTEINKGYKIPCTGCKYCLRVCPKRIAIPEIISIINSYGNPGKNDFTYALRHERLYNSIIDVKRRAGNCIQCGACERECPQKIDIKLCMKKAAKMFENARAGKFYTAERNAQILIYLMKAHEIKKVIISPGTTNICFAWSVQQDDYFEIFNVVDERSAAYMACGMAAESGEPVALSCTAATASRNYLPGLTEAYYRKLPILAITSCQRLGRVGQNIPRVIDRSISPTDTMRYKTLLPLIYDSEDEWSCGVRANEALLELRRNGGGPVHVNLETGFCNDYSTRILPPVKVIKRIQEKDRFPELSSGHIGIYCGSHQKWNEDLTDVVDRFCESYNAVVLTDHMGNYEGRYGVSASLIYSQKKVIDELKEIDLLIHIGEPARDFWHPCVKEVWRVGPDGEIRDTFRKLTYTFEMSEEFFFESYINENTGKPKRVTYYEVWKKEFRRLTLKMPEYPLSSIWIAKMVSEKIKGDAVMHFCGSYISKCFTYFEIGKTIRCYANSGGCGIDGPMSSMIGASLVDKEKRYYGIIGDLAFFYDMNCLGNRHIGENIRILLINNGCGMEMAQYHHAVAKMGKSALQNLAAEGHFGKQSPKIVKSYAEGLGFQYFAAKSKDEFIKYLDKFLDDQFNRSIVFEVFTNLEDENLALKRLMSLEGEKGDKAETKNAVDLPSRLTKDKYRVVLWGAGNMFRSYIGEILERCAVKIICDNDSTLWGTEVLTGIKCISPNEVKEMRDVFVVIMLDRAEIVLKVANQLLDMGITSFDGFRNFLTYKDYKIFHG